MASVLLVVLLSGTGCDRDTTVHIDGNNPPTISLSGNGSIYFLRVMQEPLEGKSIDLDKGGIWQVKPQGKTKELIVFQYPPIKYGEGPAGFLQGGTEKGAGPHP